MQYYLVLHDYEKDTLDVILSHSNLVFILMQMKDKADKLKYKYIGIDDLQNLYEGDYLVKEERNISLYRVESYGYIIKTYTIKKIKSYKIIEKKEKNNVLGVIKKFNRKTLKKRTPKKKKIFRNSFNILDELITNELFKRRKVIQPTGNISDTSENDNGYDSDLDTSDFSI